MLGNLKLEIKKSKNLIYKILNGDIEFLSRR